jgi:hypothetical protein
MRKHWITALILLTLLSAFAQDSKWSSGTITSVIRHSPPNSDPSMTSYDVAVKVGPTVYVVLYTVPTSLNMAEYRTGADFMVMVEGDTLTFNDVQGVSHKTQILRKETAETQQKP